MEESKKGILAVLILWIILFTSMNFIIIEKLPYYWLDYYGTRHRTLSNILVVFIIILLFLVVALPTSRSQKLRNSKNTE